MWSRHSRVPPWTPIYTDDCREVDVRFRSRCTASEMTTNWVRSEVICRLWVRGLSNNLAATSG